MDNQLPPKAELIVAGIDPEMSGDKEEAFFRERECQEISESESAARSALAELIGCPALWRVIVPAVSSRILELEKMLEYCNIPRCSQCYKMVETERCGQLFFCVNCR